MIVDQVSFWRCTLLWVCLRGAEKKNACVCVCVTILCFHKFLLLLQYFCKNNVKSWKFCIICHRLYSTQNHCDINHTCLEVRQQIESPLAVVITINPHKTLDSVQLFMRLELSLRWTDRPVIWQLEGKQERLRGQSTRSTNKTRMVRIWPRSWYPEWNAEVINTVNIDCINVMYLPIKAFETYEMLSSFFSIPYKLMKCFHRSSVYHSFTPDRK